MDRLESWYRSTLGLLGDVTGTPLEECEADLSVASVLELGFWSSLEHPLTTPGIVIAEAREPPLDVLGVLQECASTGVTRVPWPVLRMVLACQIRRTAELLAGTNIFARHVEALLAHDSAETRSEVVFDGPRSSADENPTLLGVFDVLDAFPDAPFTLQRLCEIALETIPVTSYGGNFLLTADLAAEAGDPLPRSAIHGSALDKFVFSLDRLLRVRSTLPVLSSEEYAFQIQSLSESYAAVSEATATKQVEMLALLRDRGFTKHQAEIRRAPPPILRQAPTSAHNVSLSRPMSNAQAQFNLWDGSGAGNYGYDEAFQATEAISAVLNNLPLPDGLGD